MTRRFVLGKQERMSQSVLWKVMNNAYESFGPKAWSAKKVPSYITSNPRYAQTCAHIALAFIRDNLREGAPFPINPNAPLYLFDVGAGSGRFAYLFLKYFLPLVPKNLRICYVMTDIAEQNIAFWKQHPRFQPFLLDGVLDFCRYDAAQEEPTLFLEMRQLTLFPDTWTNPAILIANYFFDTIWHDLFATRDGNLQEGLITVEYPGKENAPLDPDGITGMQYVMEFKAAPPADSYFPDNSLNEILKSYLPYNMHFTIPTGAFHVLNFFKKLTNNKFFFLASDQGSGTLEQVKINPEKLLAFHRTFSVPVNYHAMKIWMENAGAAFWMEDRPEVIFVTVAGCPGVSSDRLPETAWAFQERLDSFPTNYVNLSKNICDTIMAKSLPFLIAFLRLGQGDPIPIHLLFSDLRREIPMHPKLWPQLKQILMEAWDHHFWVTPDEGKFVMNLGCLMFDMKFFKEALFFFEQAQEIMGETPPELQQNIDIIKSAKNIV